MKIKRKINIANRVKKITQGLEYMTSKHRGPGCNPQLYMVSYLLNSSKKIYRNRDTTAVRHLP